MKKIYFAGSIRGGRDDAEIYATLINIISKYATLVSEHVSDAKLTSFGSPGKVEEIYKFDMGLLTNSDALIAEVTQPSLGVGYEIAMAEVLGKPVLALYRSQPNRRLSAMIAGSPKTHVITYNDTDEAEKAISDFIRTLKI